MNKKMVVALCIAFMLCFSLAACGRGGASSSASGAGASASSANSSAEAAASSEAASKPSKDGFDSATNTTVDVAGITFEVPSYFGTQNDKGNYYAEKGKGVTMLLASTLGDNASATEKEFIENKQEFVTSYLDGASKSGDMSIDAESIAIDDVSVAGVQAALFGFSGSVSNVSFKGIGVTFLNESTHSVGMFLLAQSDESNYDYISDFDMMVASAKSTASESGKSSAASSSASGSSQSTDADNGQVSPDLKEWLESYEAFVDEYIDFMQRYKESGDATSMMTGYLSYLQRYSDFVSKTEALENDDMSAADSAYYLEVTARISKKLLEAAI